MNKINNKLVAKNTLLLYVRMILMMAIQLYTVPIIMKCLGISDYGLYNVVGGITTFLAFVQGALTSGSQRFLSFSIGEDNNNALKQTFITTRSIYVILGMLMLIMLEIGGVWFLNAKMNIPENRLYAANWVLQFSIISFILNFINIPYTAVLIAHEKMNVYAYITITESILKLIGVILLQFIFFDKLITYSGICLASTIIIIALYHIYCISNYKECKTTSLKWNIKIGYSMIKYSIWNSIGALAGILRIQGTNILLNLFFGTIINAAHALGQQINSVISLFINNIYLASRPQITKAYAANEEKGMWLLVFQSAKLAFYLLTLLIIPILIGIDDILKIWLGKYPIYATDIIRLLLLTLLIETFSNQIIAVFQAKNKMRKFQLISSGIQLLNLPISYILLKNLNISPISPYIVSIFISSLSVICIILIAKKEINLNANKYFKEVVAKDILLFCIVFCCVYAFSTLNIESSILRIVAICFVTIIVSIPIIWKIGLNRSEKLAVIKLIKKFK